MYKKLTPNTQTSAPRFGIPNPYQKQGHVSDEDLAQKLAELINSNPDSQLHTYNIDAHEVLSRLINSFNGLQEELRVLGDLAVDAENNKEITNADKEQIDVILEEVDLELDDYKEEMDVLKSRITHTVDNLRAVMPLLGIKKANEMPLDPRAQIQLCLMAKKTFLRHIEHTTEYHEIQMKLKN